MTPSMPIALLPMSIRHRRHKTTATTRGSQTTPLLQYTQGIQMQPYDQHAWNTWMHGCMDAWIQKATASMKPVEARYIHDAINAICASADVNYCQYQLLPMSIIADVNKTLSAQNNCNNSWEPDNSLVAIHARHTNATL